MYTVEQRGFLFCKYWQTGSFKACQKAFRTEFDESCAPSKFCIQKLVKSYRQWETDLTPADFFLWGLLKGKVYKNTPPTIEQLKDALRQEIQAVNFDTLGKVFQNLRTHFNVLGSEKRPVSASVMSRSCFAPFPVYVYTFSSY